MSLLELKPGLLNLMSTFGNNLTVSTGGLTITSKGQSISYQFHSDKISPEMKKEMWTVYQARITEIKETELSDSKLCLIKAEEIIKKFQSDFQDEPSIDSIQTPKEYLRKARHLNAAVKKIFLSKVESAGAFSFQQNCFNKKIDRAERLMVQVFENLFESALKEQNYDQCCKVARRISSTQQGMQAFLRLAMIYIKQKDHNKTSQCLEMIQGEPKQKDLENFLNQIEPGDAESVSILVSALKLMKNEKSKGTIISTLVEKLLDEERVDAIDLIKLIDDDYTRKKAYSKIIDRFLKKDDVPAALEIIPQIHDDYEENQNYIKIIDLYLNQQKVPNALKVIQCVKDSYVKNQNLIKVIKFHKKAKDITNAKSVIKMLNDSYTRNQEYIKFIDGYLANKKDSEAIEKAKEIVPLINDSYTRNQQYIKFINWLLADSKVNEAKGIVPSIDDSYTRNQQYIKFIDRLLADSKVSDAKGIVALIDDSYTRDQQKAKFFKFL